MELVIQSFIETMQTLTGELPVPSGKQAESTHCSHIAIQGISYFFIYDEALINLLSQVFLLEEKPSQEEIKDLCRELSNLIIGKAKVLSNDPNIQIGLPKFLQADQIPSRFSNHAHFQTQEGRCSIYKE